MLQIEALQEQLNAEQATDKSREAALKKLEKAIQRAKRSSAGLPAMHLYAALGNLRLKRWEQAAEHAHQFISLEQAAQRPEVLLLGHQLAAYALIKDGAEEAALAELAQTDAWLDQTSSRQRALPQSLLYGNAYLGLHRLKDAQAAFTAAIEEGQAMGHAKAVVEARVQLAHTTNEMNQWKQAAELGHEALKAAQADDPEMVGQACYYLGITYVDLREMLKAQMLLEQAVELKLRYGHKDVSQAYYWLGIVHAMQRRNGLAKEIFLRGLEHVEPGDLKGRADLVGQVARAEMGVGDYENAHRHLDEAEALLAEAGETGPLCHLYQNRAFCYLRQEKFAEAEHTCHLTLSYTTSTRDQSNVHARLAYLYVAWAKTTPEQWIRERNLQGAAYHALIALPMAEERPNKEVLASLPRTMRALLKETSDRAGSIGEMEAALQSYLDRHPDVRQQWQRNKWLPLP